jgi:hypothetical protein
MADAVLLLTTEANDASDDYAAWLSECCAIS